MVLVVMVCTHCGAIVVVIVLAKWLYRMYSVSFCGGDALMLV